MDLNQGSVDPQWSIVQLQVVLEIIIIKKFSKDLMTFANVHYSLNSDWKLYLLQMQKLVGLYFQFPLVFCPLTCMPVLVV